MAKFDFKLVAAVIAPLLIWPWISPWEGDNLRGGMYSATLLVLAPVTEEVLFRGFLQGGLLGRNWFKQMTAGISRANLFTSCAFAGVHLWQHPLLLIPGYFVVSIVLGFFRERYGGLLVPILLHSYYNFGLLFFTA